MPIKLIDPAASERDGTSQTGRASSALAPSYVSVDERSAEGIVAFAKKYAKTLVYYGDDNEPDGDLCGFMGSLSPATVAAFLSDPSAFDPDKDPALFRPHFTLFLAFLRLLEEARGELNTLTRRHLDFYYRQFLRMDPRAAVPDEVNLLFSLAARESRVLVPAGTAVSAGVDSLGKDQSYRTARDIVVNRAKVAKVSSLFVERSLVGIQGSWHNHRNDPQAGRLEMLRIALGRPLPGDPLPNYPGNPSAPSGAPLADAAATDAKLSALKDLVKFSKTGLFLQLSELRGLVGLTQIAGDTESVVANKKLRYRQIIDVVAKKRAPSYAPPSDASLTFDGYASAALGPLVVPGRADVKTIAAYWSALLEIERYFGMSIENFEILVDAIMVADGDAWDAGYETDAPLVASLLEGAYHEKIRADRIADLTAARAAQATPEKGYTAALQRALGDGVTGIAVDNDLEDRLRSFLTESDRAKLAAAGDAAKAGDAARWDDVNGLLAHAMAVRLGNKAPQKEVWLNLFPADDARSVASTRGSAGYDGALPFYAFGKPIPSDSLAPPAPLLGFALTSPTLALSGGARTITLILGLRAEGYDFARLKTIFAETFGKVDKYGRSLFPLGFEVSTEKGWVPCSCPADKPPTFGLYDALIGAPTASTWSEHAGSIGLQIVLSAPESVAAIAPLPGAPDGMDKRWPAIRIVMTPVWSEAAARYVTYYRELGSLFVGAAFVRVKVAGLAPSALENDEATLDPKRPFQPFGMAPAPGSRLMIGHPEIVTKSIEAISFKYQWMGAPASLSDHYANYFVVNGNNVAPSFVVKVSEIDRSGALSLADAAPLFAPDTSAETTIQISPLSPPIAADFSPLTGAPLGSRVSTWKRRFQWELGPTDFQHRTYPALAAQKSLEFAVDSPKKAASTYQVKPPYTPKLKRLTIDYTSSTEIVLARTSAGERLDRAYHVHPFGVVEIFAENPSTELPLLPRYDKNSELYVGFAEVSLPETVTLLMALDEGSADRDVAPPEVTWSQLSGDRWIPLEHKVLADATRGLQVSGVVELALAAAAPSTLLPSGLTWVRAAAPRDHAGICDIRALHTQAALALFDDQGNDPAHFNAALPAGTITKLTSPISGIVGLKQPYSSSGGRAPEDPVRFATRVSERLRHKQRALASWDYERIVLDAFPQIFKAKCIPAPEAAPGVVEVLVIPDVRSVPTNEFGPKAPIALLGAIQRHLAARAPRFVTIRVRNPSYRAVRVRVGVRFAQAGNEGYWMGRLNEELNRFLSPWAYDEGADIVVGGRIHASSIVEFVDRRPYVDYVAGISLFYTDDEGESFHFLLPPGEGGGAYCVEAGGPDRVLVAYPKHRIDLLTTARYDARLYRGVAYMELEMDFVVG